MDRAEEWHIKERKNGRKGMLTALTITAIILLILFFFLIPLSRSEDQIEGVLIDFGNSRTGAGVNSQPQQVEQVVEEVTPEQPAETAPAETSTPDVADEVITQDFEEAPAINTEDQVDPEQLAAEQAAAEQAAAEAEAAAQAQAELEAQQQEADELKGELDNVWGNAGDGNTTPGSNQGDPSGIENGGDGSGSGSIGTGLGTREIVYDPKCRISSSEANPKKVMVQIKVNQEGEVFSATAVLKGSTTTSPQFLRKAEECAKLRKYESNYNYPEQIAIIAVNIK